MKNIKLIATILSILAAYAAFYFVCYWIADYCLRTCLDERAETDELFAKSYAKENKNLDECCSYIMGEARKRGSAVAMTDEEVFGMAIHYYDEDDIKVSKMPAGLRASISTLQPVELTEEEKKAAREAAIKRLTEEQYASLRKKTSRTRKGATEIQQMSLF